MAKANPRTFPKARKQEIVSHTFLNQGEQYQAQNI
jgi:hypothetical protein